MIFNGGFCLCKTGAFSASQLLDPLMDVLIVIWYHVRTTQMTLSAISASTLDSDW